MRRTQLASPRVVSKTAPSPNSERHLTLLEYVAKGGADVGDDLAVLLTHLQYACKRIAALVASPFNADVGRIPQGGGGGGGIGPLSSSGRDKPKPLDILSVISVLLFVDLRDSVPVVFLDW